ncbi:MAG TPA: hypothetical protein VK348_01175 [Planctomycetota bacterium]|nr:hypothetical protein [Planctomycetota bacterium]
MASSIAGSVDAAPARSCGPWAALLLLLPLLLLGQCSSAPAPRRELEVQKGQRTSVSLTQTATGQSIAMQNESAGSRVEVYSDRNNDRAPKVIDDAQMQALLDVLAAYGFFANAVPLPDGDAREFLAIEQGDRRWVWSRNVRADAAVVQAFGQARGYVMALYNQTTGYQARTISAKDLDAERQRIEQSGEAAKRKLQQGPPK